MWTAVARMLKVLERNLLRTVIKKIVLNILQALKPHENVYRGLGMRGLLSRERVAPRLCELSRELRGECSRPGDEFASRFCDVDECELELELRRRGRPAHSFRMLNKVIIVA